VSSGAGKKLLKVVILGDCVVVEKADEFTTRVCDPVVTLARQPTVLGGDPMIVQPSSATLDVDAMQHCFGLRSG